MDTPVFYNSNTQQTSFLILILKIGYEDALPHLSYSPLAHLWQEIRSCIVDGMVTTKKSVITKALYPNSLLAGTKVSSAHGDGRSRQGYRGKNVGAESA